MTEIEQASRAFLKAAERSSTLYELSDTYIHLLMLLEDPDVDSHQIEQHLDTITGAIKEKAEAIAGLIRWCEGLAEMRRVEAKRMLDSAAPFANKADWLRDYVLRNMQATGIERIDTARFTLKIKTNPPRVEVLEPMLVPSEYQRQKIVVEVDKRKILEHLKETGEVVEGTEIVRGQRLDIS
jgi:hypothetical protein